MFNALRNTVFTAVAAAFGIAAVAHPIAVPGTESFAVIASGGDIVATYLGTTASYSDDLLLNGTLIFNNHATAVGSQVDLGSFAAGTELVFQLRVNTTGRSFYSGTASRNADNMAHARVQSNYLSAGTTLVSFEDLYGDPEGIKGFNDLSFSFTRSVGVPTAVPEPQTWALMLAGLGALGFIGHRRTRGRIVG